MKKNYLTSNHKKVNRLSLKQSILALFFMLSVSFAFAQETVTVVTTSTSANWSMNFLNSGGIAFSWLATGSGIPNTPGTGNNPSFDFSVNDGSPITITITSNDNFDFVTELFASAQDIISIDVANIENLIKLELPNNALTTINLSTNTVLTRLFLSNNLLSTIDLTTNTALENLELQINNLSTLDLSTNSALLRLNTSVNNLSSINILNNINLMFLDLSSNQLTSLNLSNNSSLSQINLLSNLLTTNAIGQVLNDVDAYGTGSFGYILDLRGNPGDIPASAIPARDNLEGRGWIVRPPSIYDFGDAPNSYTTDRASGGPQHIIGDGDLNLGLIFDDELDGFPSPNADGDDLDKQADEDGVTAADLDGILSSTDNFTIDVDITNNTSNAANLYAWIDFDGSGTFDADEYTTAPAPNGGVSVVTLSWTNIIANGIISGDTYARFRISSDVIAANQPGGLVNNGEVEDYFLTIDLDTDNDSVPDINDDDADNDGILNTDEVGDTNGNGIADMLELDSDGDTCFDVTEAGFTDGDGDGILGTSPVVVDANGLITADALGPITDGFTTPNDLDNNLVYDFQEAGAAATITTEPIDQDLIIGVSIFSVVATADTYQWEESQDGGTTWIALVDGGDYAGATLADLSVTNADLNKLNYRYRVIVNNIGFACDPTTTSIDVGYITPDDFDLDGVFDIVDNDDDNDGILDINEDNGVADRDTDGDGFPDRIDLDADGDLCFDVTEAGFTDVNGNGMLGDDPVNVDPITGLVTSGSDGYTLPVADLNANGIPDFQEAGLAANITTQPVDQDLIIGDVTFTVVTDLVAGDESYQWQESIGGVGPWTDIIDAPGAYSGATTASLVVTNVDVSRLTDRYRILVSNVAYACDPIITSDEVTYITPIDTDGDLVFDIVDVDDDNDGILDINEDNGVADRDTDGDGFPDRIDLDADGDLCFDVTEAGFTDVNGNGMLGDAAITVDINGQVTSGSDGYTLPVADLNANGIPDFQEAGLAANITTQPVDQIFVLAGTSTFSVVTDLIAGDESYQWEESIDNGVTWNPLADGGDYAGTTTADLIITNPDFSKVNYRYRVLVSNIAYACDPVTTSTDATFITPGDFDKDGVFDVVDFDDDNDGILDTDEDNGVADRDTDGDGFPDRIDLDADGDACFDVIEAGFTDDNGDGMLGDFPVAVDANGQVISGSDGYTLPDDKNVSGTPDFQEAGAAATITTQPTDQNLVIGISTFTVVATADTYQWEESQDGGTTWVPLVDGGDYAGAITNNLMVTNSDVSKFTYRYRVLVNNISYACDPITTSVEVGYTILSDFDLDGIFDLVDVDDDNDGILDVDEAGNTIAATNPDRINLDADSDGCPDVTEAGFTNNGADMLGTANPVIVDATGKVTSTTDGYTLPLADNNSSGTPDFQEAGSAPTITTQPVDASIIITQDASFTVVGSAFSYQWQESVDNGTTWLDIVDGGFYSGAMTSDLLLTAPSVTMDGYLYRVQLTNPDYACDPILFSIPSALSIFASDFDGDGVPDLLDLDDDNDGILDTVEGDTTDTTGDGNLDKMNLDADADGCFDVVEAGFVDGDNDGILGTSPVSVDVNGQVTGQGGYTPPNDLDGNGTFDFQEAGVAAIITDQPIDQDFVLDGNATYSTITTGDTYRWQESDDSGLTWTTLSEGGNYSGTATNQLTVSNLTIDMYFYDYRVIVQNIAYACDLGTISDIVTYNELEDTDTDGVFDIIDDDDDNDGILDTVEGDGDTDGDGIPDRIDLDSDGDSCPDVTEAGFTNNGADMLGTSNPPTVDANGQVTSANDGYTTPNDLNSNGVYDFQEAGSASNITSQPEDIEITLGDEATFTVSGSATYYKWQVSLDRGSTWSDIEESSKYSGTRTNTLLIYDARSREESNMYRVILTSPDYACDPNPELYSTSAILLFNSELIPNGFSPNGDGRNDYFIIPGLAQYPNFTMEVFDRWGNSVYKYENGGSLSPQWWDGTAKGSMVLNNGERVPAATYFYMIDYNDDKEKPKKGWVYVNY